MVIRYLADDPFSRIALLFTTKTRETYLPHCPNSIIHIVLLDDNSKTKDAHRQKNRTESHRIPKYQSDNHVSSTEAENDWYAFL